MRTVTSRRVPVASQTVVDCRKCFRTCRAPLPRRLLCLNAAPNEKQQDPQQQSASSTGQPEAAVNQIKVTREWTSLGSRVIETNQKFTGPEDKEDFWEGAKFEAFGKTLENYFVPGIIVLGLICGGLAARSYNEGATAFLKEPGSPDDEASIIIATPEVMNAAQQAPPVAADDK
eukprot:jgi/Chrzof1/12561/UNPLg00513.t1